MTDDSTPDRFSLSRWSRRKLESARTDPAASPPATPPGTRTDAAAGKQEPQGGAAPVTAGAAGTHSPGTTGPAATAAAAPTASPPLPPIDSLGIDADFTGFFKPDVAPSLRNAALKKLFADPRFNVMDGLDTYVDDYSVFVPLDAEEARGLVQARAILDPPKMRVNDQGNAELAPTEEPPVASPAGAPAPAAPDATAQDDAGVDPGAQGVDAPNPAAAPAPAPAADPAPAPAATEPTSAPSRGPTATRPRR
jgi:hypothetical protein